MPKSPLTLVFGLLASSAFVLGGCAESTRINKTAQGALAGAALGAGSGAIVGNQSGHAGPGVAIGAGIGLLTGALAGAALDEADARNRAVEADLAENQRLIEENRRLIEELRRRGADVHASSRGVVVNLPDVLFEFDRSRLTREAKLTVAEIAEVLQSVEGRTIAVEGHTDSIGSLSYNKRLSLFRARSVADELARRGISSSQMEVAGFGEGAPIATNSTPAGRARNRRVEVVVENY